MYSLTAHPTSLQVPYPAHSTQSLKKKKKQFSFNSSPWSFWQQGPVSWKTIFFLMDQELGDGFGMIQVHYLYCEIYFYYYCISSTSGHLAFDSTGWGRLL